MIKQYFSDGLLQIAIILSLFRTDLNSFYVPNNELLNYPEVQDILQGQTMAYLPTSFHNQYNTLNSIGGYHPKHVESDFYFSSLFRELRALSGFRQVSTNIEAFLVSDSTVGFPPCQTASSGPIPTSSADASNNAVGGNGASTAAAQAHVEGVLQSVESVDNNLSVVGGVVTVADFNNNVTFHSPFPGCDLTKEDLDLIDVLWRQDVDLGVGKEVFDPNLRRELERERELEFRKETEKRKEAEKRQKDRRQQAHQWLTQNFMRDGETGEWVPIAGPDNTQFSPSGPQSTNYPDLEQAEPDFTLDDALEYINQYNDGATSVQQQQHLQHPQGQQFDLTSSLLPSNQNLTAPLTETFDADSLIVEAEKFSFTNLNNNQSDQERLEQNWQELVSLLNETEVNATVSNTTTAMPPIDTQTLLQQPPTSTMNEMHMLHQQQMNGNLNLNMNNSAQYSEHSFSASTSMNETCMLLQQNSSLAESVMMGDGGMLLQNATLPAPMDNVSVIVDSKTLLNDSGLHCSSPQYNATAPGQDTLSPLDWEVGELFFLNVSGLSNLSCAIASATMLDSSDILPEFLPDEDLDMALNEGLQSIQVLDDGGSDSAVSMGSGSPRQEVNETMELSPFDGLEGATGGSDYDHSSTYSHQETHTRSTSGSVEDEGFHYSCSSYGSPASVNTNCSTGSNDTEHSSSQSATATSHVHHNHTYPTQPGQVPREVKKYAKKDGPRQKGPTSRDVKKAQELKIPFSFERIIEAPVEEFNDMITKTKLTEQQMAMMRDIRRRGKNKVAAQNCRKRKLSVLFNLEDDMGELQRTRDKLVHERHQIDLQTRQTKDKYTALYDHIFRSLRDELGRPFDPNEYSLQQSSDGNVFLVPRNCSTAISTPSSSSGTTPNKRMSPGNSANKDKDRSEQKKKSRE